MGARRAGRRFSHFFAGVSLLALTGCAVAQIDVDVYKGPLADHEDTQIKRLEGLTVATNTLLNQLKDKFHDPADKQKFDQVRAVLSLYEDLRDIIDPATIEIVEAADKYLPIYEDNARQLVARTNDGGDIWDQIKSGLVAPEDIEDHVKDLGATDANTSAAIAALKVLQNRYEAFFRLPRGRRAQDLPKYSNELRLTLDANKIPRVGFSLGLENNRVNSNAEFAWILAAGTLADERRLLFSDPDSNQAKLFEAEAKKAAMAYLGSRKALQDLWRAGAQVIDRIHREDELDMARRAIAGLVSQIVNPRHIIAASLVDGTNGPAKLLVAKLKKFSDAEQWTQKYWNNSGPGRACFGGARAERAAKTVTFALIHDEEVARLLLEADELLSYARFDLGTPTASELSRCFKDTYLNEQFVQRGLATGRQASTTRFGLTRGPTFAGTVVRSLAATRERIVAVTSAVAALGLDRGRERRGIYSLLNEFRAAERAATSPAESAKAFKRLRDGLVSFSQKIIALADNQELLEGGGTGNVDDLVLPLQSLGNTILYLTDELTHREEHRDKQRRASPRERAAIERAYATKTKTPAAAYQGIAAWISTQLKPKPGSGAAAKLQAEIVKKQAVVNAVTLQIGNSASGLVKGENDAKARVQTHTESCRAATLATLVSTPSADKTARMPVALANQACSPGLNSVVTSMRSQVDVIVGASPRGGTDALKAQNLISDIAAAVQVFVTQFNLTPGVVASRVSNAHGAINNATITAPESTHAKNIAKLLTKLSTDADAAAAALQSAQQNATAATAALNTKKAELAKLQGEIAALNAQIGTVSAATADNDVRTFVGSVQTGLIAKYPSPTNRVTEADVKAKLVGVLRAKTATTAAEIAAKPRAISLAAAYPLPKPSPVQTASASSDETAVEVLDKVITALRQDHIHTVARFGKDHANSKKAEEAIEVALKQRAAMTYIRPSAAYLRSSFTASGLQDNVGTAWENLLRQHAGRGLPLIGFQSTEQNRDRQKVIRSIDKQFWQNINKVRVSGSGTTNYAIAKDDVGNWYVKSFASDPEDIINSASQLALFNIGGTLGQNLLPDPAQGQPDADGNVPQISNRAKTTLERLFDKHAARFDERTEEDRKAVAAALTDGSLANGVVAAWNATIDNDKSEKFSAEQKAALKNALKKVSDEATASLPAVGATVSQTKKDGNDLTGAEKGANIVTALNAMRRAAKQVVQNAAVVTEPQGMDGDAMMVWQALRQSASNQAKVSYGDFLRRMQTRRNLAVSEFSTSLVFIGDAVKE